MWRGTHRTKRSTDDSNSWLHTRSSTHTESKPRWVTAHGQKWILETFRKSGETVHDIKLGTDTLETKARTVRETIGVISVSNYTEVRFTSVKETRRSPSDSMSETHSATKGLGYTE